MGHYRAATWLKYIEGNIGEDQALAMEQHLTQCDLCLELYASAAENSVCQQVSSQFTDGVMARIASLEKYSTTKKDSRQAKNQRNWRVDQNAVSVPKVMPVTRSTAEKTPRGRNSRQALGNYAIAACLTLLLTAGGVFGGVASAIPEIKGIEISFADKAAKKAGSGWSQVIAEKTLSILDTVKPD